LDRRAACSDASRRPREERGWGRSGGVVVGGGASTSSLHGGKLKTRLPMRRVSQAGMPREVGLLSPATTDMPFVRLVVQGGRRHGCALHSWGRLRQQSRSASLKLLSFRRIANLKSPRATKEVIWDGWTGLSRTCRWCGARVASRGSTRRLTCRSSTRETDSSTRETAGATCPHSRMEM
jgi:hypothetical protein